MAGEMATVVHHEAYGKFSTMHTYPGPQISQLHHGHLIIACNNCYLLFYSVKIHSAPSCPKSIAHLRALHEYVLLDHHGAVSEANDKKMSVDPRRTGLPREGGGQGGLVREAKKAQY